MVAIAQSLSGPDRSVKTINALLTLVSKNNEERSEFPLQTIGTPEKSPDFSSPNLSYNQENDRKRSTPYTDQSVGLPETWMRYWTHCDEIDLNPLFSRRDIPATLLQPELQGDHQVPASIFIPVSSADSRTTPKRALAAS